MALGCAPLGRGFEGLLNGLNGLVEKNVGSVASLVKPLRFLNQPCKFRVLQNELMDVLMLD